MGAMARRIGKVHLLRQPQIGENVGFSKLALPLNF